VRVGATLCLKRNWVEGGGEALAWLQARIGKNWEGREDWTGLDK